MKKKYIVETTPHYFECKNDKEPFLCKCRNEEEGAMTVKRVNDDFHQCPRCGGLLVFSAKVDAKLIAEALFELEFSESCLQEKSDTEIALGLLKCEKKAKAIVNHINKGE